MGFRHTGWGEDRGAVSDPLLHCGVVDGGDRAAPEGTLNVVLPVGLVSGLGGGPVSEFGFDEPQAPIRQGGLSGLGIYPRPPGLLYLDLALEPVGIDPASEALG